MSNVINETLLEIEQILSKLDATGPIKNTPDCKGFLDNRKCEEAKCRKGFQKSLSEAEVDTLRNQLQGKVDSKATDDANPLSSMLDKMPNDQNTIPIITSSTVECNDPAGCPQRSKRQSPPEESPYETFLVIECLKKGTPMNSDTSMCGLCDTCWQIGLLKEPFLPRFVNLLACDSNTRCLSGYGECRARNTTLSSFVKNSGTKEDPKWDPFSINVPQMCDCQLPENSPLLTLATNP